MRLEKVCSNGTPQPSVKESPSINMRRAGPVRRDYPLSSPELAEVRALIATTQTPYLKVSTERWSVELRK